MRLPRLVLLLGFAGLIPFLAGPAWLTFAHDSAPAWLDRVWIAYVTLIAAFLAGTFWGFALPAAQGAAGMAGLLIASVLLWLTGVAMLLPFRDSLIGFLVVFLLLLGADVWRERVLDTIPGYFLMRTTLTVGVFVAVAWRLLLAG